MPHEDLIVNGVKWPSVTEILNILEKPGLENWERAVGLEKANEIRAFTSERGSDVHKEISDYLKTTILKTSSSEAFQVWHREFWTNDPWSCGMSEKHLISKKLKFHGTVDALLTFHGNDELWITDWKISNSDDPMRAFQLAGYAILAEEELKTKVNKGAIIRIEFKKNKQHIVTPRLAMPWYYEDLRPFKVMFKALVKEYYKNYIRYPEEQVKLK